MPKALALANAERVALAVSGPFEFLETVLGPVVRLLELVTNAIYAPARVPSIRIAAGCRWKS